MKSLGGMTARIRGLDPGRLDLLLAMALLAGSAAELSVQLGRSHRPAVTMITLLVLCAGVALRRRWPVALAAGGLVCILLFERFGEVSDWMLPSLGLLIYMYTVGAQVPGRRGLIAAGGLVLLTFIVVSLDPSGSKQSSVDAVVPVVLFSVMPIAVGRALANRRALTHELRAKAVHLEREREDRARQAAASERIRIARELHDVIAHGVSVMVIQTQAARRVASADREAAQAALAAVESAGRDALFEMRRMVGVLRRGDEALAAAGAPGLAQVPVLADRARAAGLPVELHIEGNAHPLPAGLDLTAYRVVQEALTNVVKHAGSARARVTVGYRRDELRLEITDTGCGSGVRPTNGASGHGLIGMQERLVLYGGELTAGRRADGGFSVRARIPLTQVAA